MILELNRTRRPHALLSLFLAAAAAHAVSGAEPELAINSSPPILTLHPAYRSKVPPWSKRENTTIWLPPHARATLDAYGNLALDLARRRER